MLNQSRSRVHTGTERGQRPSIFYKRQCLSIPYKRQASVRHLLLGPLDRVWGLPAVRRPPPYQAITGDSSKGGGSGGDLHGEGEAEQARLEETTQVLKSEVRTAVQEVLQERDKAVQQRSKAMEEQNTVLRDVIVEICIMLTWVALAYAVHATGHVQVSALQDPTKYQHHTMYFLVCLLLAFRSATNVLRVMLGRLLGGSLPRAA